MCLAAAVVADQTDPFACPQLKVRSWSRRLSVYDLDKCKTWRTVMIPSKKNLPQAGFDAYHSR
jgi:hypothetical protein